MLDIFEEIFERVTTIHNVAWWETAENYMDEVNALIAETFGAEVLESEEYNLWFTDLCMSI